MPLLRRVAYAVAALHLTGAAAWNFVNGDELKDITAKNENVFVSCEWPQLITVCLSKLSLTLYSYLGWFIPWPHLLIKTCRTD
jgi:hypothetical protein